MGRVSRRLTREAGKFLATIGLTAYGRRLWDLSAPPPEAPAPVRCGAAIERQVLDQARHDPAIVAAGRAATPFLQQLRRDLPHLWGFSAAPLFEAGDGVPSAVFIAARLDAETAGRLTRMMDGLRGLGAGRFVVVLGERGPALSPPGFDGVQVVVWRDHYADEDQSAARLLATYVHALGAPTVVSFRCRLGLETIGFYGGALKSCHRLFAVLDAPAEAGAPLEEIHLLRITAPHATLLARTEAEAALLRDHRAGLDGPGVAVLGDADLASPDALAAIFGATFADARSETSRTVAAALLGRQVAPPPHAPMPSPMPEAGAPDITVTIVFHRERELAVPALASLTDMVAAARRDGCTVEARAFLDNADEATRALVAAHGAVLDDIREVSFGDPALARNAGVAAARGRFLAFVDGDDLWGADWLSLGYRAATAPGAPSWAVWHPEAYMLFYGSDCLRRSDQGEPGVQSRFFIQQSSRAADFEPRDLLIESLWTANALVPRAVYERFPYRPNEWARQIGIEDWRWNLETLGHGVEHLIVPETVHMVRIKEGGSLGQLHDARGLLPILT